MKITLPNRGLNTAVLHIAQRLNPCGFDVVPEAEAPKTLGQLQTYVTRHHRIAVNDGFSESTIFVDREVNYAFRAWHDWCHWRGSHPFDLAGERACANMQIEHVRLLFGFDGDDANMFCAIIDEEVNGQAAYHAARGEFVTNQMVFAMRYLGAMGHAIVWDGALFNAMSSPSAQLDLPLREMLHAA